MVHQKIQILFFDFDTGIDMYVEGTGFARNYKQITV
jgi:hypothetical protein